MSVLSCCEQRPSLSDLETVSMRGLNPGVILKELYLGEVLWLHAKTLKECKYRAQLFLPHNAPVSVESG
jgi:hypothetical protein